jgi:alkaline phosphatase
MRRKGAKFTTSAHLEDAVGLYGSPRHRENGRLVTVILTVFVVLMLIVSASWAARRARSVILMIGDGMGPAQLGLLLDYCNYVEGRRASIETLIERGNTGYMTTHPLGALVTDSAASATALATGRKVRNGVISWCEEDGELPTVLEEARAAGKAVGLVTTTRLSHATPAAFSAHCESRNMEERIARQELYSGVDVLLGGGGRYFEDLIDTAAVLGYTIVRTSDELRALDMRRCDRVLGLFADSHMSYEIDRDGSGQPSLAEMTAAAIARLERDMDGFFLMVEGGRIDHACHDNDPATALRDLLAFDEAVGIALEHADRRRGTLLLATADHETGGMGLSSVWGEDGDGTREHLALLGRQRSSFAKLLYGAPGFLTAGAIEEMISEGAGVEIEKETAARAAASDRTPFFGCSRTNILGRAIGPSVHIDWVSTNHTATPLWIFGDGPGAERFRGIHDVAEVGGLLFRVMDVRDNRRLQSRLGVLFRGRRDRSMIEAADPVYP